ncbi:hypothetical protein QIS74_06738 [Colletotrichum tabaci]|uniref:Uncharacterized protein n=1 Tax=Colletotrichum tabaci TaxID=1209068 RepID=A0AAV9T9W4_9PEZI
MAAVIVDTNLDSSASTYSVPHCTWTATPAWLFAGVDPTPLIDAMEPIPTPHF